MTSCLISSLFSLSRLDSKSGSMCSSAIASPTSPTSPMSPRSPPRSPDPESLHPPARKQTSYTSFQNAVLSGIQKLLPVATGEPHSSVYAMSIVKVYIMNHLLYHVFRLYRALNFASSSCIITLCHSPSFV